MELTGSQIVIEQLCKHGVTTVFGYPGGAVLPLYDELYKNSDRVHHVISAHEQGAAHAADGYARVSGKTGVVISTSGPGATNLVTGIANAYLDSVPMVAITGNVAVPLLGRDSFQEVDTGGITAPIVKHNYVVREINQLEQILEEAFSIAGGGRPGPVVVDLPRSIQTESCEYYGDLVHVERKTPQRPDLRKVIKAIKKSKKPYIYAGGGVISSEASDQLKTLSQRISAPVGLSMMGLTTLPNDYELNLGMCGMHGNFAASKAQSECDLMLALGVRFSDRATGNVEQFRRGRTIVHIDIDNAEIGKNVSSQIEVCGDIRAVIEALLEELPSMKNQEWLDSIEQFKLVDTNSQQGDFTPQEIIETVARLHDSDTVVATDVGQHQMWTMLYYKFFKPRTLLTSGGLGTMGYGLGAAIGGSMARDGKKTILITSDGSFGMNLNELATAVSQKLPIVIILLNNGVLGMVRQWQNMFYGQRYSQTTLDRKTDFVALAKAFGGQGYRATSISQLEDVLNNVADNGPTVIECLIDRDEKVLPMIPPGGSVKDILIRS